MSRRRAVTVALSPRSPGALAARALALALGWAAGAALAEEDAPLPPLAGDPGEADARDRAARALDPLVATHGRLAAVAAALGLDAPARTAAGGPGPTPGAVGAGAPPVDAPPAAVGAPPGPSDRVTFRAWLDALPRARAQPDDAGGLAGLRRLLDAGEEALDDGRPRDALPPLLRADASPAFDALREASPGAPAPGEAEAHAAALARGRALLALGAWPSARALLGAELARVGPSPRWLPPAHRLAVDVALASGDLEDGAAWLAEHTRADAPEDAVAGLAYVRGRARLAAGDVDGARVALAAVGRRSRFFAPARYLLGALAVREGDLVGAEAAFCGIAEAPEADRLTFFVDDRHFASRDLAWLALGRVAHELGRGDDAFYYYFQVPSDAGRVETALFEGAWATYEAGDAATALDLLDQLAARFPDTTHAAEAALLRGYLSLERCRFEDALAAFDRLRAAWAPVRDAIGAWIEAPDAAARALALVTPGPEGAELPVPGGVDPAGGWLAAALRADPGVRRLAGTLARLDDALAGVPASEARLAALERLTPAARSLAAAERAALARDLASARAAREALATALGERALARARRAHGALVGVLRRARLGRIDAIMGSRRRIERQIAELAAGRFPDELFEPLRMQGLLRSDEAYWPYDGEWWADELEERLPPAEAE